MSTVYVSIGNSDDKLTQAEWSDFHRETDAAIRMYARSVHGHWLSAADAPWQNACWCFEVSENATLYLRDQLSTLTGRWRQDSIAYALAETQFIGPRASA